MRYLASHHDPSPTILPSFPAVSIGFAFLPFFFCCPFLHALNSHPITLNTCIISPASYTICCLHSHFLYHIPLHHNPVHHLPSRRFVYHITFILLISFPIPVEVGSNIFLFTTALFSSSVACLA
ncbi:hypothetical protein BJ912DRAFT_945223, partial [Pholiota molesta]